MTVRILIGDVRDQLAKLPDDHFDCIVTSPPYWGLRDYGVAGQIGLEPTLGEHLAVMVDLFRDLRRVLKPSGTLWLNYGDCYATSPNGRSAAATKAAGGDDRTFRDKPFSTVQGLMKPKDLCMVPNRLAIALQDDGWFVRSEIIWGKTNPMPESVSDRPATAHEKIFMLTKSGRYSYDTEAVRQGRASDENANGFRGGSYVGGEPGGRSESGNYRVPAGWDTSKGAGGHGSIHRTGRERSDSFARHHKAGAGGHGQSAQHRPGREDVVYLRVRGRNLRNYEPAPVSVWPMAAVPFACELCADCGRFFDRRGVAQLRLETIASDQGEVRRRYCVCGSHTGWLSHFATFPPQLVERCLDGGCPPNGSVFDPFGGAGTTALVADGRGLDCTLIELNPLYATLAMHRIASARPESDILMEAA